MKILGTYTITYDGNISQEKNLIEHSDYICVIKPTNQKITELEMKQPLSNNTKKKIKALKQELLEMFGENWFTNQSPLFEAMETGILSLPKQQGGDHNCKVVLS
jgi:hypothetical protein